LFTIIAETVQKRFDGLKNFADILFNTEKIFSNDDVTLVICLTHGFPQQYDNFIMRMALFPRFWNNLPPVIFCKL